MVRLAINKVQKQTNQITNENIRLKMLIKEEKAKLQLK